MPLEAITSADLQTLVNEEYPEGSTVEFKRSLPTKKGAADTWADDRRISEYGRTEVLAEAVALANAQGGHVILGIDESDTHPKRAVGFCPIPACADLANRLRLQARDCIEPQLPTFGVVGVPMADEGSGVIIMRIPQSRRAPHRLLPNLQCYIRRSDRTETMTMREIQDITLQRDRGLLKIDARFVEGQSTFRDELHRYGSQTNSPHPIGIRASLVPTTAELWASQVYKRRDIQPVYQEFEIGWAQAVYKLPALGTYLTARPVVGGVRYTTDLSGFCERVEIFRDGVVNWMFFDSGLSGSEAFKPQVYPEWVLGVALRGMLTADGFRRAVGAPDAEYGLEIEVARLSAQASITRFDRAWPDQVFGTMEPNPLRLSRLSLGDRSEIPTLLNLILTDLLNSAGKDPGLDRLTINLPPVSGS
jgi:hypothetical protein